MNFKLPLTLIILSILSSCSVYKAASNEGVSVSDIAKCRTKGCLLSLGMDIVDGHDIDTGEYVETYKGKARKTGLNYIRAAGHGVLDVATLGAWEVVGTPVEGALSNNLGYVTVIATYKCRGEANFKKAEMYDSHGRSVGRKEDNPFSKS